MNESQTTNRSSTSSSASMEFCADQRDELTEYLRSRLIECGWRDQVASMCRNLIQKHGVEQIKLAQIVGEVRSEARDKIPDNVRTEMLAKIRKLNQESKMVSQPTATSATNTQPPTITEQ